MLMKASRVDISEVGVEAHIPGHGDCKGKGPGVGRPKWSRNRKSPLWLEEREAEGAHSE